MGSLMSVAGKQCGPVVLQDRWRGVEAYCDVL